MNEWPTIGNVELDLRRLYQVVSDVGGCQNAEDLDVVSFSVQRIMDSKQTNKLEMRARGSSAGYRECVRHGDDARETKTKWSKNVKSTGED